MQIPKPSETPLAKTHNTAPDEKPGFVKKPFVPKPHLTQRPFVANQGMRALQGQLRNNKQRSKK